MTLPTELVSYILQFLSVEEQLKVLDSSMQLLYCLGLPKSEVLERILQYCEENNYVNVLQYILETNEYAICEILRIAASNGRIDLVKQVISLTRLESSDYEKFVGYATDNGHLAIVERLLQIPGVDATANDNNVIHRAASHGHLAVVERILQIPGVDATTHDNYAIQHAARNGHLAVVERLLQIPGVDAAANDNYAIRHAAENGHLAVVERLLQIAGVDPTANNNYAIQKAARNGHLAVVARLLQVSAVHEATIRNGLYCSNDHNFTILSI